MSGIASIASRGISMLFQVGSTIILARLLTPEDFGLVAMVLAFTGFAPVLVDLGTRDAAVQRTTITPPEVSALFFMTMGIGVALAIALVLLSPVLADFYDEPRLTKIACALSLTFVLSAGACMHTALLRRGMEFHKIAIIDVGATIVGAAGAVSLGLAHWGYWALVAKLLLTSTVGLVGTLWFCRWMPGRPAWTANVKEMVRFGLNITGFAVTDFASRSVDRAAIGRSWGPSDLGHYQQGLFVYDNTLGLLVISLHPVAVAGLSKLADDVSEFKRSWSRGLSTLAFFGMPAFALLAVTGPDLIATLLGPKWLFTGTLLSILALRGIPHVVERTIGWLHVPAGRSDRWMRWGIISAAVQLISLFVGLPFGVTGVAIAYVVSTYLLFIPAVAYAGKPLGINAVDVVRAVGPQLVGALATTGIAFGIRSQLPDGMNALVSIALLASISCGIYLIVVVGMFRVTEPLRTASALMEAARGKLTRA